MSDNNYNVNENEEIVENITEEVNEEVNDEAAGDITEEITEEVNLNKKSYKKGKIAGLKGRNFKQGLYSSILAVFVVVIVILLNLFVGQLNLKVDLTTEDVYTLTDETKNMASELKDEIEIYYLVKEGEEYEVLKNVVEQYDKLPNIKTISKDPELYPQFAAQYTSEELSGNDVIVVNKTDGSSRFIPFDDMYISDYQINYSTYNYDYKYTLDAEGQITSAIQYVTAESHSKMYIVSSHGETELGEKVLDLVNKANVETAEFNSLSEGAVPEDCDILFINGPITDISDEELAMYKEYLDNGGKAIMTVAYSDKDLTNYYSLLEYYGIEATKGVVLEKAGNYMNEYPTYLLAGFSSVTDDISAEFTMDNYIIMPIATILKTKDESELRGTLKLSNIIMSSEDSYGKTNPESTVIGKEDGDPEGPFSLVVQATDTYKDKSSKVAVYSSPFMIVDDWIDYYECSNVDLFIDTIDWMSDSQSVTIPKRSLDGVYLEVPQSDATMWAAITVVIIPVCILICGFVVWYRRRKR